MRHLVGAAVLLTLAAGIPATAADVEKGPVTVSNVSNRIADCAVLIDGRIKYYVKIRPGKTWSDEFQKIRELKLVCERSKEFFFGPLELGGSYRIYEKNRWLEFESAEGPSSAEASKP